MTAADSQFSEAALRIERMCQAAVEGRLASRSLTLWAKSFDLGEPELQVLWCLHQESSDGVDQTTIARELAFSPAQVSSTVERLRSLRLDRAAADRRRQAATPMATFGRWASADVADAGVRGRGAHC